jgi:HlyD family secretion protein
MHASFTVDAYPGETFEGKISQVRLSATTVQNVVTYSAIINVDNPQLKLKPGMTANVKILIKKASDALKVPNAALRFRPDSKNTKMEKEADKDGAVVWLFANGGTDLQPIFVQLGLTDGVSTQIIGGNLKAGDRIVTGMEADSKNASATSTSANKSLGFGGPMGGPMGLPPQ